MLQNLKLKIGIDSKRGEDIVPAIQHGCFKDGREKEELLLLVERGLGICEIGLTDWWHVVRKI